MVSPIRRLRGLYQRAVTWLFWLVLDRFVSALSWRVADNDAYLVFAKHGYYLLRQHYYLPIPDESDLTYAKETDLVGIDIDERVAFDLLDRVVATYKSEFNALPTHRSEDPTQFYLLNGAFMAIDGNVYYSLIRHHKPRRIIEIGSGNSTLLAAAAIRRNRAESGHESELIAIEPYPNAALRRGLREVTRVIDRKVQEIGLDVFQSLQTGDILFIDSTHVLKTGGDVWWEYCEILPRLASGVLVHIHDISLPQPYPRVYFQQHLYWNEQYVLQAFLAFNSRFEVLWPGNLLMTRHPDRIRAAFRPEYDLMRNEYPSSEPTSLWMRVR